MNPSSWLLADPRCSPGEVGSSEVQRLGQVVRDMDGQFGSGVYYSTRETEASASCLPSRACWETNTSSNTSHLLANLKSTSFSTDLLSDQSSLFQCFGSSIGWWWAGRPASHWRPVCLYVLALSSRGDALQLSVNSTIPHNKGEEKIAKMKQKY